MREYMRKDKLRYGEIIADLYYPAEHNKTVIIFCSGLPGRWNFEEIARKYVEKGFIFIHPKYIGSWESYGKFSVSSCKKTILLFVEGLKTGKIKTIFGKDFKIMPDKIFLLGHSFGGSIALSSGADLDINGIIALSPVIDYSKHARDKVLQEEDLSELFDFMKLGFENIFRGLDKNEWVSFCKTGLDINPIDYKEKLKNKKILLGHGKRDSSVNYVRTKSFYEELKNKGANIEYIETEDNHGDIKESIILQIINWITLKNETL
jgi:dienelactone hydrolase